ncbi:copper resistance CopC/CopD family protein [Ectobacillus panaciterrae]|uniref:copper resistance CopC/CopD family protein n=1 Tax=Ectobacillus panaciterrae TaxID=363872 RepID=UPI0004058118
MAGIKKLGLWMLMVYVLIILVPTFASAHAYIIKATPMENEILAKAPSVISIEFDEEIQSSGFDSLIVIDASGKRVDLKNTHINKKKPKIIETGVQKNIPKGTYSIQWKVISADGHPVQGVIPFSIGTPGKDSSTLQAKTTGYIPKADMIIERVLLYTSFALYIGVIFFNLIIYRANHNQSTKVQSRNKLILWLSLLGITVSLLFSLPLQATINADVPWSQAFSPSLLKETLELPAFGHVWIIQMVLVSILALTTYLAIKRGEFSSFKAWGVQIIIILGLLVTKALTGHASGSKYKEIAVFMDFLHLLSASLWVGGIAAIVFILPAGDTSKENDKRDWSLYWDAIRRFSPWAMAAAAVIFFTGIVASTLFVPTINSLFHTGYGQTLLAKIVLFVVMIVLGAVHFVKSKIRRSKGLGVTAGVELSVGIIVMAIAAILTNLPTPPVPATGPIHETKQLDNGYQLTLSISPNVVGMNTFDIDLKDKSGQPVTDIEQITLTVSSLDMEMGKDTFRVPAVSIGKFQTRGMYFNMTGQWNIHVHGLTTSLDSFDIDFRSTVGNR